MRARLVGRMRQMLKKGECGLCWDCDDDGEGMAAVVVEEDEKRE